MIISAFTCTGPYAILIMLGIKRVENRSIMPVPAKGRCAVTCSKSFNAAEYGAFVAWAAVNLPPEDFERLPAWADVKDWPGKVIGCCDYAADMCRMKVRPSSDTCCTAWDEGYDCWWNLSNVVCFDRPIPCRGNVGMWQLPNGRDLSRGRKPDAAEGRARPSLAEVVSAADALASCVGEKIATAEDAARLFRLAAPLAGGNEGFFVLPLDDSLSALSEPILVSLGDPTTTTVQPNEVFSAALKAGATALILAHNHPSGDPTPSVQDRALTAELAALGERLNVKVLDHLIISQQSKLYSPVPLH